MTVPGLSAQRQVQIAFERARQGLGWTGLGGAALMLAALLVFVQALNGQPRERSAAPVQPTAASPQAPTPPAPAVTTPEARQAVELPLLAEVPLLLTQIKQIAVNNGLGWTTADYRFIGATSALPASLEVRSQFKAPYPRLRQMLAEVLAEVPASTLRELSFSRANSDIADVEVKVVIAVFLREAPSTAATTVFVKDGP